MSTSSFPDSFDDSLQTTESTHSFVKSDYTPPPYNPNFAESDPFSDSLHDSSNSVFGSYNIPSENGSFVGQNSPVLPPHDDMQEEGFALREWRRENAMLLEEKEKKEKELLSQIVEEANEFKVAFHRKTKTTRENNITNNREKEKVILADLEKFHKEADENYWKSISELIPNEVPVFKKRGKKDDSKKPAVVVIQGPKPGKPTDLARMRQILVKLKHDTPDHLKLASNADKDTKAATVALTSEAVVVS